MTFAPKRRQPAIPAQAMTAVATPNKEVSMEEFYRTIFNDPRAAQDGSGRESQSEDEMVRFYRKLNAKPAQSDADSKQGKHALMAANEDDQDASQNTTNSTLIYPTAEPFVTSPYGWRRHPKTLKRDFHSATDFRNGKGSPVFSCRDGKVVAKGQDSKGTSFVKIQDKDGIVFGYFHNGSDLNIGDAVNMGDIIGHSDASGLATAPHLHLTIEPDGTRASRKDPDKFLKDNKAGKKKGKE